MATRSNRSPNPAAKNNVTGYGYFSGGSSVAQATGLSGYSRTTGARFTSSGTPISPVGEFSELGLRSQVLGTSK